MPIYVTDYYVLNEVGRLCKMGGKIEAATLAEAEKIAADTGHTILGEWQGDVDWPEGDDFCDDIVRQRDADWLKGQR